MDDELPVEELLLRMSGDPAKWQGQQQFLKVMNAPVVRTFTTTAGRSPRRTRPARSPASRSFRMNVKWVKGDCGGPVMVGLSAQGINTKGVVGGPAPADLSRSTHMSAKTTTAIDRKSNALSDAEKAALKETVNERKRASRRDPAAAREDGERDVREKIAEMASPDRVMAKKIDAIVKEVAPDLVPRTWYGMPAYAKDGKVICFFKAASKYGERYATLGFDMAANLEDGTMWPTAWCLTKLTPADEKRITALVKKAVS